MSTEDPTRDAELEGRRSRADDGVVGAGGGRREERVTPSADPRMSRSMEYGLAILESFSGERPWLGIADLADLVGTKRSTTHRYVVTLVALGYLEQGAKRKYRLAPPAAGAGMAALGALRLSDPARKTLERLREWTGCTVGVGIRDETRALYIDRIPGHRAGQVHVDAGLGIGVPVPLHCTALGKALLAGLSAPELAEVLARMELKRCGPKSIVELGGLEAELDRIRQSGLAVSDEELRPGACAIAVRVVDPRLKRQMAIDLTAPVPADGVQRLRTQLAPQLERAAELVAAQ
jgi:IclR family transcriptional regulator, pca regulon regulatory protein